tara:strand:+ start:480 stop:860 length:381 start_codon:yes stop_codon:yes gene_type:complete
MKLYDKYHSDYGVINSKLAMRYVDRRGGDYKRIFFIFTNVSPKRILTPNFKENNILGLANGLIKVILVNNKALMDFNHEYAHAFNDVRELVFDGKLGQRYNGSSSAGPYFHCLINTKTGVTAQVNE